MAVIATPSFTSMLLNLTHPDLFKCSTSGNALKVGSNYASNLLGLGLHTHSRHSQRIAPSTCQR